MTIGLNINSRGSIVGGLIVKGLIVGGSIVAVPFKEIINFNYFN